MSAARREHPSSRHARDQARGAVAPAVRLAIASIASIAAGAASLPLPASAEPGQDEPSDREPWSGGAQAERTVFLPTAFTLPSGACDATLYELGLAALACGASDRLQLSAGGTYLPPTEVIGLVGAKVALGSVGDTHAALFVDYALDVPFEGVVGVVPLIGGVVTRCDPARRFCSSGVLFAAAPASRSGVDFVFTAAATGALRAADFLLLLAEIHLRAVVPEPQVGTTAVLALRWHSRTLALDTGWMVDGGIFGPALPVVEFPGLPVVNAAVAF